jgi:hypothetical protein
MHFVLRTDMMFFIGLAGVGTRKWFPGVTGLRLRAQQRHSRILCQAGRRSFQAVTKERVLRFQ